jgi:hypothetical protein
MFVTGLRVDLGGASCGEEEVVFEMVRTGPGLVVACVGMTVGGVFVTGLDIGDFTGVVCCGWT